MSSKWCTLYANWVRFWHRNSPIYELTLLLIRLFPHARRCKDEINGVKMALDLTDVLQANLLIERIWEPRFTRWLPHFAKSSETIIDIGGHVGYFSLLARRASAESARIFTFEPNPKMQQQIIENIELNQFTGMTLAPVAVGETPGKMLLNVRNALEPGASSSSDVPHTSQTLTVPVVNLEHYRAENDITFVGVLKMDIEGGELGALLGMKNGLNAGVYRTLLIELHPHLLPAEAEDILSGLFADANYHVFSIEEDCAHLLPEGSALLANDQVLVIHADHISEESLQLTIEDGGKKLCLPA